MYVTQRRLCLNSKGKIVAEGHPDAQFLLYPKGVEVPPDEMRRYGLPEADVPYRPTEAEIKARKNPMAPPKLFTAPELPTTSAYPDR